MKLVFNLLILTINIFNYSYIKNIIINYNYSNSDKNINNNNFLYEIIFQIVRTLRTLKMNQNFDDTCNQKQRVL